MNHLLKKGYKDGFKSIEIQEGNIDLVLYNEKGTNFYFYRFSPEQVFGTELDKQIVLLNPKQVGNFIKRFDRDYDGLINELLQIALESKMTERYE